MAVIEAAPGTLLLLIRHGETAWNREGRIQGHQDAPLSERGLLQARLLARWLEPERLDAIYSSDLQRSRVTAEVLAERRSPVLLEPRVREGRFGAFEGLTHGEIRERYPEAYAAWRADALRNRPPGGETLEDLQERCMGALREHLPRHPGRAVAVVTHGGPIRVMVCGVLGLPMEVYPRLRVENTAVTRLLFTERGAILAGFNEVPHLRDAAAPEHTGWEER
jgi:probable phosphoglycerate mutase